MLRSDKILQKKTLHCMVWWSSMPGVEFYRLYNGVWACDLMPCLCRVFAVIFAIFTEVCRVFHHFCRDFLLSLYIEYTWPSARTLTINPHCVCYTWQTQQPPKYIVTKELIRRTTEDNIEPVVANQRVNRPIYCRPTRCFNYCDRWDEHWSYTTSSARFNQNNTVLDTP